jgi:hypothetical protein
VRTRAALNANAKVDWTQFGCRVGVAPNPAVIPSGTVALSNNPALTARIDFVSGDQNGASTRETDALEHGGCLGDGWRGHFATADGVLWTAHNPGPAVSGPLRLTFSRCVRAVGAQIQPDLPALSFTAQIQAFDQNGALIGGATVSGNNSGGVGTFGNNTSPFLGVRSVPCSRICSIVFGLVAASEGNLANFAINQLSVLL